MKIHKRKIKKTFIFKIEIISGCWDYKDGDIINIPVISNNLYNACRKFDNKLQGGSFPTYKVNDVYECDNFLFNPIFNDLI